MPSINRIKSHTSLIASAVKLSLGMFTFITAPLSLAQQTATETDNTAYEVIDMERIMVSAQKRTERLQDVPISMEVLDADALAQTGKAKLADFYAEIPGLSYYSNAMSSAIIMRGIGTDVGLGSRPTAGITIDDVPYGSATNTGVMPDLDPSDIQQIEILRGPQGTLYGASSMGGLVKYVSVLPRTDFASAKVAVNGSNVDKGNTGYGVRASGNLPVNDDLAIRASVFTREDPSYVTNTRDGAENGVQAEGGRVAALWNISDDVNLQTSAMFQNTNTDGTAAVDLTSDLQPIYDKYQHERMVGTDNYEGQTRFYTAKLNANLGWASFDAISGYSEHRSSAKQDVSYTSIGNVAPMFANMLGLGFSEAGALIDNRYDEDKFSQELRLSSIQDAALEWQVGLFYTKEDADVTQNFFLGDNPTGEVFEGVALLSSEGKDSYKETAVFANITYKVNDKLDVTLGGRYADNKIVAKGVTGGMLIDGEVTHDVYEDNIFTYLLSSRYHFNPDLMGYARISSGYRAGGSNSGIVDGIPEGYESDTLVSYELGIKGDLLDKKIAMDAALFYIDWSDLQLSQLDLTYGESYTTNAGKAVSQGLELGSSYYFAQDWTLAFSYAFTDASLSEDIPGFVEDSTAYGKKGDRLPFSAKNSATLSLSHDMDVANGMLLSLKASTTYMSDRYMQFTQSSTLNRLEVPSYLSAGLSATLHKGPWSATFYANNLFNEEGYINLSRRGTPTDGNDVDYSGVIIQPRTVGITLSWEM